MKVLKFGGKSLANGTPFTQSFNAIIAHATPLVVVVSARAKATDELLHLMHLAASRMPYEQQFETFCTYQKAIAGEVLHDDLNALKQLLTAVFLLGEISQNTSDKIVAYGEVLSAKTLVYALQSSGHEATFVDSRAIIKVKRTLDNHQVDHQLSAQLTKERIGQISGIAVVTGFIAADENGKTVTLGRNGSNYSAALIASYLDAEELKNYTNVNGLYTANPEWVPTAQLIPTLTYKEANELVHFGANVLHPQTLIPLIEKQIPLRILNSFEPDNEGTLINAIGGNKAIKAVNAISDIALISIEGNGLQNEIGIDARIFNTLQQVGISVRMISQASSERGIGFVINKEFAAKALQKLRKEFENELQKGILSSITENSEVCIVAITGRHNYALEKAISGLRKNKIWMHLINNSINGEQISLVVSKKDMKKALNVVHNQVFGAIKTLHVVAFGKGTVGGTFIDQVVNTQTELTHKRKLLVKIVGIVDSTKFAWNPNGFSENWREEQALATLSNSLETIFEHIHASGLENVVVADNTASKTLVASYPEMIRQGCDIIASNKTANSIDLHFYKSLRETCAKRGRHFLYETNVGAGLPVIDTLKQLHLANEKIKAIKGIFSGSMSYTFNTFSHRNSKFSEVLLEAKAKGFTEPDPREDLSGNDVARKLLILAREIGLDFEFADIEIENLIPEALRNVDTWEHFTQHFDALDAHYEALIAACKPNEVLRYVGQLTSDQKLKVALVKAESGSALASITGADSVFEIYTEDYGDKPIVIQGAGAGARVTARGVYSDLLRIGAKI